jgi:hypothetical protein
MVKNKNREEKEMKKETRYQLNYCSKHNIKPTGNRSDTQRLIDNRVDAINARRGISTPSGDFNHHMCELEHERDVIRNGGIDY